MQNFKDINFPLTAQYSSDSEHIPLEFYENAIPKAKTMDMVLGYFSTNAIQTLCLGFSEFIYLGGSLRIVTNHQLTQEDKHNLLSEPTLNNENQIIDIFQDLRRLKEELGPFGQHFFDCLKFLLKKKRLIVQPVMHKPNAMAHYKKIILFDGENYLYVSGSANFTTAGIIKNGESFIVDQSWGGETEKLRIEQERKNFDLIFEKKHASYDYLNPEEVIGIIQHIGNDLTELELLEKTCEMTKCFSHSARIKKIIDRREIEFNTLLEQQNKYPKFPFPNGALDYQEQAYKNWVDNDYKGLFAMATGTGKTITALNCVLNLHEKTKSYNFIILVPSISLLNQWEGEVQRFNFKAILKVGGGNNWEKSFADYCSNFKYGLKSDLCIIAVNDSFASPKFQKYYKNIEKDFIFIADEAHNLGSNTFKNILTKINPDKRIGLSATPKRIYDPEGTNFLNAFFEDEEPYCYNFSMARALKEGRLTNYFYYPLIVKLEKDEQEEYNSISKQLLKFFDFENGCFKDNPLVEALLLKRKRIIHKASGKSLLFKQILKKLKDSGKLKYVFTYVPEGEQDGTRLIDDFIKTADQFDSNLKLASYTAKDNNHKDILDSFSEGVIDIVFAMKMLDEGVDIPRTEIGIFASSTGNPRQYIQRRGRLLRNHKDKVFATVYDMVVIPNKNNEDRSLFNIERNLLKTELNRVAYFASLSLNAEDSRKELQDLCNSYDLNIDILIQELEA
jgi:superfamily II DNA or RNA helicase